MQLRLGFAGAVVLVLVSCVSGTDLEIQEVERGPAQLEMMLATAGSIESMPATEEPVFSHNEIFTAPVPDGVDPELWAKLCSELATMVASRDRSAGRPAAVVSVNPRTASFTPYGLDNQVHDLKLSGGGPWLLSWTYRNKGDYDMNGAVNISDLTPVGIFFGVSSADMFWFMAAHADGDGNGEINVSDITPIGQNFGGTIVGYRVYGVNNPGESWTYIGDATVATNLQSNKLRPRFIIKLDSLDFSYYAIWPYDNSDDEGGWSNMAGLDISGKRRAIGVEGLW